MIRRLTLASLLSILAACTATPASTRPATQPASTRPTAATQPAVYIQSLAIQPARQQAILALFAGQRDSFRMDRPDPAIHLSFQLLAPELNVIALDNFALSSVRDDRGKNLELPARSSYRPRSSPIDAPVSQDGHHIFATASVIDPPTSGATELEITGNFTVRLGASIESSTQKLPVRVGSSFTVDHTTFTISGINPWKTDSPGANILFKIEGPTAHIQKLTFLAPDETPLTSRPSRIDDPIGNRPATWYYYLPRTVDKLTVSASWYSEQKSLDIPFTLHTGIGLAVPADSAFIAFRAPPLPPPAAGILPLHPEVIGLTFDHTVSEDQARHWFPGNDSYAFFHRGEATISLFLQVPDPLLKLPETPIEITALTDDLGSDLLHGSARQASSNTGIRSLEGPAMTPDRRAFLFNVELAHLPAPGAKFITCAGILRYPSADNPKTIETKNIPLEIGQTIPAGPITLTITGLSSVGKSFSITLLADKYPDVIQKIEFLDSSGKTISASPYGWRDRRPPGDPDACTFHYNVASLQDSMTFRITYFEKITQKSYPVTFTTTIAP